MSFWGNADGSAENAFSKGFSPIPDGEMAEAELKDAKRVDSPEYGSRYELTWRITNGEYSGRLVFQKIHAFDQDQKRADRARNMLLLIFKLFNLPITPEEPVDRDFVAALGRVAIIKIGYWKKDDKDGNFVREVHPVPSGIQSALSANHFQNTLSAPEDDLPF